MSSLDKRPLIQTKLDDGRVPPFKSLTRKVFSLETRLSYKNITEDEKTEEKSSATFPCNYERVSLSIE